MKRLCKNCTRFMFENEDQRCVNKGKELCFNYEPTYAKLESEYYELRAICVKCVKTDSMGDTIEDIEYWLKQNPL